MRADSLVADVQPVGDLQVGQPLAQQAQHLELLRGEQPAVRRRCLFGQRSGGEADFTVQHLFDRLHQLRQRAAFIDETVGAGGMRHARIDIGFLRGIDQDLLLRIAAADFFQQLQPVDLRQADIQDHQAVSGLGQQGQCLYVILRRLQAVGAG